MPLHLFGCRSEQKKVQNEDTDTFGVVDLALPASTDVPSIMKQFRKRWTARDDGGFLPTSP